MKQLEISNLKLSYDGKTRLRDVSFGVNEGNYICIVGENGAGKTTLANAVLGLKQPDSGSIALLGINRGDIGYLPQQTDIQRNFPASVMEIVMTGFLNAKRHSFFYTRAEYKKAHEVLASLGIAELSKECYRNLSGGQQQRVLLARAICAASKMLVLDEPTASLDPAAAEELYSLVNKLNKKQHITVLMITHDISAAKKYATHILYLSDETAWFSTAAEFFGDKNNADGGDII